MKTILCPLDIFLLSLKNGPSPASFPFIFVFQTSFTIFTTIKCEKWPSSKCCRDSNTQPSKHESPPITNRTGLIFVIRIWDVIFLFFQINNLQESNICLNLVSVILTYFIKFIKFVRKINNFFIICGNTVNTNRKGRWLESYPLK